MTDNTSIARLNQLHPSIRQEALEAYNNACKQTPIGVHPFIVQTLRTFAESDALYAQGRTKPGAIVSNAKAGQSLHNYGLALDFCLLVNGKQVWDEKNPHWMTVVKCFEEKGFEWGGRWKSLKDFPHLQKTGGYSWKQLLALHNEGKFIPGETYVNV